MVNTVTEPNHPIQTAPEDLIDAMIGLRDEMVNRLTVALAQGIALRREVVALKSHADFQAAELTRLRSIIESKGTEQ